MRRSLLVLVALGLAATAAWSGPKTFGEILADVREEYAALQRVALDHRAGHAPPGALVDGIKKQVEIRGRLRDACDRTNRRLTKVGGLYFETKPLEALGWTFDDPPDEVRTDPVKTRSRDPELVAARKPAGAAPDVTLRVEGFCHVCVTATDKKEKEAYPFAGIDRDVVCSDVAAVLQAHVDQWKKACAETSSPVAVAKKQTGIARWSASLVGKSGADAGAARREWYAWEGETFNFLHSGATFVVTAEYIGAAMDDPKAAQQVQDFLKALQPTIK